MADVRISARSTLTSLNRWVEVISGNLVGAQITGFKSTRITFGDSLVDIVRGASGNTGTLGGINPVQIGSGGITVGGTTTDFRQGSLIQTGNNNDLSIQGNAFFTTADSAGKIIYTRSGEFSFDDQGYLVTKEGNFVLGFYDRTRSILKSALFPDINGSNPPTGGGVTVDFGTSALRGSDPRLGGTVAVGQWSLATIFGTAAAAGNEMTVYKYFVDPNLADQDRVVGRVFVPSGSLSVTAGQLACATTAGAIIGTIAGIGISLFLPDAANTATRTSADNARLIAKAINDQSNNTGLAASVVVNLNDQNQATIVIGHVNRTISESAARLPTNPANLASLNTQRLVEGILSTSRTGLVDTFKDNKGNLFYKLNSLILAGGAPQYAPAPGDVINFDSNGTLINNSKGKDEESAPPFNTGAHVAISKFSNNQGLEKRRGGSQFTYTEATGVIQIGYAGMSKTSQVSTKLGVEEDGTTSIGLENVIIAQSLESSNSSVTEALPELTVAQKTFTSNTKVVNVGNTIVDDLNGLIR
ncbi:MAG: flagellar hook-basal body complex protein [Candidatus Sericytochromatia bacterium]